MLEQTCLFIGFLAVVAVRAFIILPETNPLIDPL